MYGVAKVARLTSAEGKEYRAFIPGSVQKAIGAREPPFYLLNNGSTAKGPQQELLQCLLYVKSCHAKAQRPQCHDQDEMVTISTHQGF